MNSKPMLNAYPDSLGGNLGNIVTLLKTEDLQDVFSSFYILPSLYHSDLDRGFSVIDYDLNEQLANREDLDRLKNMGIDLKLDFILNHASAQSPQFRDLVEKGEASAYRDFFIDWNHFWEGHGTMTEEGYIQPDESCLKQMFFRKPGLPILMVEFPDGKKVPYWNTFYQEVHGRQYLGQMDVNIQSPKVWEFYRETLEKIASYGAAIVRLPMHRKHRERKTSSMIRRRGNFYKRSMHWQNLWDLRFCRRSTRHMMKKYMRHLQKKAMQPTTFSCRD